VTGKLGDVVGDVDGAGVDGLADGLADGDEDGVTVGELLVGLFVISGFSGFSVSSSARR